jgi:hypothetical protein
MASEQMVPHAVAFGSRKSGSQTIRITGHRQVVLAKPTRSANLRFDLYQPFEQKQRLLLERHLLQIGWCFGHRTNREGFFARHGCSRRRGRYLARFHFKLPEAIRSFSAERVARSHQFHFV